MSDRCDDRHAPQCLHALQLLDKHFLFAESARGDGEARHHRHGQTLRDACDEHHDEAVDEREYPATAEMRPPNEEVTQCEPSHFQTPAHDSVVPTSSSSSRPN